MTTCDLFLTCDVEVLAFGKGIFGATTIIPDSIGWANCKARLGEEGLAYFQNEVPDPTTHGLWTMVMAILGVELAGPHQDRRGETKKYLLKIAGGVRTCA